MQNTIKVFSDLRVAEKEYFRQPEQPQFEHFNYYMPALPEWTNKEYKYKDESINLYLLTCTCQEYKAKTKIYPYRDIRSLCTHIYTKIKHSKAKEHIDQLSLMLLESATVFGENQLLKGLINSKDVYVGLKPNNDWINIYTEFPVYYDLSRKQSKYFKYSYSIKNNRWAYNTYPYNENTIKPIILKALENNSIIQK